MLGGVADEAGTHIQHPGPRHRGRVREGRGSGGFARTDRRRGNRQAQKGRPQGTPHSMPALNRSTMRAPTRNALAMMVSVMGTPPLVGMKEPSLT